MTILPKDTRRLVTRFLTSLVLFVLVAQPIAQSPGVRVNGTNVPNAVSSVAANVVVIPTNEKDRYIVTVLRTAFVCAAVTCDVTIGTIPAKTAITGLYADLTQTFACTATCTTGTLSFILGIAAAGNTLLVTFDADAAVLQRGLVNADYGTALITSATNPFGVGYIPSWTATTPLILRLTSGTGNIGNATVTNLSQGSITFYVTTKRLL